MHSHGIFYTERQINGSIHNNFNKIRQKRIANEFEVMRSVVEEPKMLLRK